jgi:hypothetical protein
VGTRSINQLSEVADRFFFEDPVGHRMALNDVEAKPGPTPRLTGPMTTLKRLWSLPNDSNSGMNLLRATLAPLSGGARLFRTINFSGSHAVTALLLRSSQCGCYVPAGKSARQPCGRRSMYEGHEALSMVRDGGICSDSAHRSGFEPDDPVSLNGNFTLSHRCRYPVTSPNADPA